jgi:hypothetical protein
VERARRSDEVELCNALQAALRDWRVKGRKRGRVFASLPHRHCFNSLRIHSGVSVRDVPESTEVQVSPYAVPILSRCVPIALTSLVDRLQLPLLFLRRGRTTYPWPLPTSLTRREPCWNRPSASTWWRTANPVRPLSSPPQSPVCPRIVDRFSLDTDTFGLYNIDGGDKENQQPKKRFASATSGGLSSQAERERHKQQVHATSPLPSPLSLCGSVLTHPPCYLTHSSRTSAIASPLLTRKISPNSPLRSADSKQHGTIRRRRRESWQRRRVV